MLSGAAFNAEIAARYSRWLAAQRYSPVTQGLYSRTVRNFCDFLGELRATDCTPLEIQEYLVQLTQRRPTASALCNELYSLRIFYDFLCLGQLVIWSPPRLLQGRPIPKRVPRSLSETQVKRVLRAARNIRERAILEVLYGTGCRTGELRSMKVEDVDFNARRIRVKGKTGTRYVHFVGAIATTLRDYIGTRRTDYLFMDGKAPQELHPQQQGFAAWRCTWKEYDARGTGSRVNAYVGRAAKLSYKEALVHFSKIANLPALARPRGLKPLTTGALTQTVQKIGLRVGIHVHPGILRHTFATHLLDHGADIDIIKELLGHKRLDTTNLYAQISKPKLRQTLDRYHPLQHSQARRRSLCRVKLRAR
jgi:integrase/recombinase XerC